jgi:transcriptional regulator PpsR
VISDLSVQHDVRVTLDDDGFIRHAVVANAIADESVADWFGQRWVETIDGFNPTRFSELVGLARRHGVSPVFQVTQRFPSGLAVPIEYLAIPSHAGGMIAVGRDVRAVTQLQSRLAAVQQSMEHGYWKLRDIENRYRVLFESSSEAIAVVDTGELRIVEANLAAASAFGIAAWRMQRRGGYPLLDLIAPGDMGKVEAALQRAQERGKAPRIVVHLKHRNVAWLLRASALDVERGEHLLLNLLPATDLQQPGRQADCDQDPTAELVRRSPDGVVVIDCRGEIVSANPAFLALVEERMSARVLGTPLSDWLRPPGGDAQLLLDSLQLQQVVPLFPTTVYGSLGHRAAAEIAAARIGESESAFCGVYVRDVSRRWSAAEKSVRFGRLLDSLNDQLGHASLKKLVGTTVGLVERHFIEAALTATGGNRTAAAKLLELSRQSLYVKLARYGIAENDLDG